jgi:glycosyltransferase 2 family protein
MAKKRLTDLLKVLISLGLVALLLKEIGFQQTLSVFARANAWFLLAALGLYLLGIVIKTFRWQVLLDALGIPVAFWELVALNFIGFLFNNILPSGIGGDVVKMYELSKDSRRGAESVNAVFVDRVVGLIVAQALAIIAAGLGFRLISHGVLLITVGLFVASLVFMWVLVQRPLWEGILDRLTFLRKWKQGAWDARIRRLFGAFQGYDRAAILKSVAVSVVFNVTLVMSNYCVALALHQNISMAYFWVYVPITSIITMIPVSLNGLGLREMGYVALFTQAGVAREVAFSMSLTIYSFTVISGLVGGVIYIVRGARGALLKEASR